MGVMRLERVTLENFRSYKKQVFHFGETTVIVAPNGAGKTNLLEAIFLLSTGISERAGETSEMINWESEIGSVSGVVEDREERTEIAVVLSRGAYMGKVVNKRRYLVDGVPRTRAKLAGLLPCVMFRPEDMRLVEGSPSRRRAFLDEVLTAAHPEYARAQAVYEASLRRRNKLLDGIREGTVRREQLSYWDQSVIKNGNIMTDYRRKLTEYLSGVQTSFGQYLVEYDASTISSSRLAQYSEAEAAVGYTLVGPHKDDFAIFGGGRNLMIYGSRGEQRLAVLFLKLGALKYMESLPVLTGKAKIKPVLLLDDIFSELDEKHRGEVVAMTEGRQTIITSAEEETIGLLPQAEVVRL